MLEAEAGLHQFKTILGNTAGGEALSQKTKTKTKILRKEVRVLPYFADGRIFYHLFHVLDF